MSLSKKRIIESIQEITKALDSLKKEQSEILEEYKTALQQVSAKRLKNEVLEQFKKNEHGV